MKTGRNACRKSKVRRPEVNGFTLVEMLVAVGLVVLMMSLFATIFQFATQSMGAQKGTAENDQKVRLVLTLLRNDIRYRTMQVVAPYISGATDTFSTNVINATERQGYLYIAENDPDDDTDDILQLTVNLPVSDEPFYGAARVLLPRQADGRFGTPASPALPDYPNASNSLPAVGQPQIAGAGNYWVNQPEFDDGLLGLPNGAGSSRTAEVSYFLRKGTLYRRVLLVRTVPNQTVMPADAQPRDNASAPLGEEIYGSSATVPRNFYTYFDYAAYFDGTTLRFHAANTVGSTMDNSAAGSTNAIGKPPYRFGHNFANGLPREFIATGPGSANYIGRFTHEETSFMTGSGSIQFFGYPGKVGNATSAYPNPMDDTGSGPALTVNAETGKVDQYVGGSRIGEDILMTNVMRFDIKVWDDAAGLGPDGQPGKAFDDTSTLGTDESNDDMAGGSNDTAEIGWPGSDDGAFVNLGHNGFFYGGNDVSFYSFRRLANNFYCPVNVNKPGTRLYRYDTWHPIVNLDGAAPDDPAPFRPADIGPIGTDPARVRALKAVQITITFLDPTTQQIRDVTFVASLMPAI